ncbi:MAG: glycosyltransferase family 4 protein [Synergistaceae bacterium]|nr:glycosyltransferase family 4 protein [Synergistaceae bacterium]
MKILHIVPEFHEGGVERYVLEMSREQTAHGHSVSLATAGGKLEPLLPPEVKVLHLPVQRKNPLTGLYCALYLAARRKRWNLIHVHSRVPAWIAWWASALTALWGRRLPWIMTAHAPYSLNAGITPLRHADGAICVSEAVRRHLEGYLPHRAVTLPNGVKKPSVLWRGEGFLNGHPRFLFVGYLARRKGLDVALRALGELKDRDWTLDVLGDGAQREEWTALARELGLEGRITFHGFRDDAEEWMSRSGCLLFPSYEEGLPLTVLEALAVGLPVLASDIEPLRPLASGPLIPPGDVAAWRAALERVLDGWPASPLSVRGLPTFEDTVRDTEAFYTEVLGQ